MFRNIREQKHVHFTQKIDNHLVPHKQETRSRLDNRLVIPRYSKSKCQNPFLFRGIKSWNTTPDDIEQSANLAKFKKKYVNRFILSLSYSLIDKSNWLYFTLKIKIVNS